MKAIQIKYLAPTNTKPARLKAFTDAGSITESANDGLDSHTQALLLVERYIKEKKWNVNIDGFGVLPNGDYVATIGNL